MSSAAIQIEPFFLDGAHGSLFCLYLAPADRAPQGGILYCPPFAEEMHKSRRMAALQARAFAQAGYAVLQIDLTGCGDSSGDFGDATWAIWRADIQRAHAWLAAKVPGPLTLWGLRLGATLATELAPKLPSIERLLLWQPVLNGDQFLTQFLRIKLASEMLSMGQTQTGTKELRATLAAGETLEIGGLRLSPAMADNLSRLNLMQCQPPCAVDWIEVSNHAGEQLAPAGQKVTDQWRASGSTVRTQTVPGEPFWNTQEISECAPLITASLEAISACTT